MTSAPAEPSHPGVPSVSGGADGGATAQPGPPFPAGLMLSPFRAVRYDPDVVDLSVATSPPYDVIDADGVAALEQASDVNVVRLILPREATNGREPAPDRYARAAGQLADWRRTGVLKADEQAALYVYEQADPATGHVQRGLLGALALTPAEDGIVLPHENTMAGPVADRLALYTAVEADLEPIFLLYAGDGAAADAVASVDARPPLVDVELPDGLRHRLWALRDATELAAVADDLLPRVAVIADGHHRYATYLRRQQLAHEAGRGAGPWDVGLTFLVDANAFGPQVHAIHRVLPGQSANDLAERASTGMRVHDLDGQDITDGMRALATAGRSGSAFLLVSGDGGTMRLLSDADPRQCSAALPPERSAAWRSLDVSVLHRYIVPALWELPDDERTVGYEHDVPSALAAAARTEGTAVLLNPTPVEAVTTVAAGGERMPRKSTLFTPKPRTGLVLRAFADADPPGEPQPA